MSRTNIKRAPSMANLGFTILEMVIGLSIGCVVLAATLGAYTYLAHGLARLAGNEEQQTKSRRMMYLFSQDVGSAAGVTATAASPLSLTLEMYTPTPSPTPPAVTYNYAPASKTFQRTDIAGNSLSLDGVSAAALTYYDGAELPVTDGNTISIKNIGLTLTLDPPASAGSGTQMKAVNARVVMRNKRLLGSETSLPTPTPTP